MDIIQFAGDILIALSKHGWSLTTLAIFVATLIKFEPFVRMVMRYIPKRFIKIDNRMERLEAKQDMVNAKLDLLLTERGITWDAHYTSTSTLRSVTISQKMNLWLWLTKRFRARTIGESICQTERLYHSKIRGESIRMKNKLLSRKLWMTILGAVVIVLNQQLGMELNADSIFGIGSLIMSFVLGQSVVDMNGLGQFAPLIEKLKSSKLWVSLLGSIFIVLNDHLQWGMTPENIYVIVGIAVSFILGKSGVSYVQASNKDASHYR